MVEMGREFSFCDCHAGGVNATVLGKMLRRTDDAGVIASRNNITIRVMYQRDGFTERYRGNYVGVIFFYIIICTAI